MFLIYFQVSAVLAWGSNVPDSKRSHSASAIHTAKPFSKSIGRTRRASMMYGRSPRKSL